MTSAPKRGQATIADLYALPDDNRYELIRGTLVEKEAGTVEHARAQVGTSGTLFSHFQRGRGGGSTGWWFFTEVDLKLGAELFRPDVCGYRRERMPEPPAGRPLTQVPDWICEILSASNESRDRVEKLETYFRSGLPHYWLLNPVQGTLEVLRRTDLSFALVLTPHGGQRVRAEPFEAVELSIDELLGFDPAE
jgi:Uma2 family endonuclease